jgi:hypothetical protein
VNHDGSIEEQSASILADIGERKIQSPELEEQMKFRHDEEPDGYHAFRNS